MWRIHKFLILFLLFTLLCTGPGWTQERVEVRGKIHLPGNAKLPETGLAVVLLKFVLDANGQLQTTGPIARTQTGTSGQFKFDPIALETKAAYQLGSRFEGNLVQSEFFFIKPGQMQTNIDITLPGISEKTEDLEVLNAVLFIEPSIGQVLITEVLTVNNATANIIDAQKNPLIIDLPASYQQFDPLHRSAQPPQDYALLGQQLQYHRQFPRGETTLAFRYRLPVLFGSYELHKHYRFPMKAGRVLTPTGQLNLESPQLKYSKIETVGEGQFHSWEFIPLNQPELFIQISAIPSKQIVYGYIGLGVFIILIALAYAFVRFRL